MHVAQLCHKLCSTLAINHWLFKTQLRLANSVNLWVFLCYLINLFRNAIVDFLTKSLNFLCLLKWIDRKWYEIVCTKKQLKRKIDLTSSAIVSDHIVVHKPLVRLISLSIWTCFSRLSYCFGFVWLFVWILFQLALRSVSMFAVCFIFLHHFCIARAEWNSIHVHDHDRYWYIFQHAIDRFRLFSIH